MNLEEEGVLGVSGGRSLRCVPWEGVLGVSGGKES